MSGYKRVNFYELCRLCATNQQRHVTTHIFKEEGKRMQLQDKIHNCLSLKVEEDDFLPKVVCSKCLAVLEQSNTFRKECVKSELMLSTYYNNFRYTPDFTESGKVYIKDINAPILPNGQTINQAIIHNINTLPNKSNNPPKLTPKPANTFSAVNTQGDVITILECAKPSPPKIVKAKKVAPISHNVQSAQNLKQQQNTVLVDNSNVPYANPTKKQRIKIEGKQHVIPVQQVNTQQSLEIDLDSLEKETHVNLSNNVYHQLKPVAITTQTTTMQQPQQTQQTYNTYNTLDSQQYSSYGNPGTSHLNNQQQTQNSISANIISSNNQWVNINANQENQNQNQLQQHNVIMTSAAQTSNAMTVVTNQQQATALLNSVQVHHPQKILPKIEPMEQKHLTTINLESISTGGGGNNNNAIAVTPTTSRRGFNNKVKKEPIPREVKHYICEVCSKMFKRREHLYQHMKLHSGFRPFACAVCAKTFMRKEHLLRHQTSHSGQKNYTCSTCDKSFSRNDNLLKHKKTHDKQPVQYECDICPKVFVLKHYYITHKLTHEMQANQKLQNRNIVATNSNNCWQGPQNTSTSLKV